MPSRRVSLDAFRQDGWRCRFGRMQQTLEEVGFLDPRDFEPVVNDRDGLERLIPKLGLD